MLQQTRAAVVIPYYRRFLARFPDIRFLAAAPQEDVLRLWSGLGYYRRARNLQRAAQEIVAKHGGAFPPSRKDVLALPGIGPYTAAAILSIAFGSKYAVLDGNVARVLARLLAIRGDLREARRWQTLQRAADGLLDRRSPGDCNQALMELGAMLCTPRSPQCLLCPVAHFCRARKLGIADSLPARRRKPTAVEVALAAAVLVDEQGRTLLLAPNACATKNDPVDDVATLVSHMWHFPMIAMRESAPAEIQESLKILFSKGLPLRTLPMEPLPRVRHTVTYRRITVWPFRVAVAKLPATDGAKICSLAEVAALSSSLAISNLTRKTARAAITHGDLGSFASIPKSSAIALFERDKSPQTGP